MYGRSLIEGNFEANDSSLPNMFSRVLSERGVIHVSNLLGNIVDFEESQQENTVVIRSGVSEALDSIRERYEDLDNVRQDCCYLCVVQNYNSNVDTNVRTGVDGGGVSSPGGESCAGVYHSPIHPSSRVCNLLRFPYDTARFRVSIPRRRHNILLQGIYTFRHSYRFGTSSSPLSLR